MNTESIMERKIKKLEKRVMLHRFFFLFCFACLVIAASSNIRKVVRAERFELVDKQGRKRMLMKYENNLSGILLFDKNEKVMAEFAVAETGARITLRDENKVNRIVATAENNRPNITLFDTDFEPRAVVGLLDQGRPAFTLVDDKNTGRLGMALLEKGEPNFVFKDKDGNVRVGLISVEDGPNTFTFYDKDKEIIWRAP